MEKDNILKEVLAYMNIPMFKADDGIKEQVFKNYELLDQEIIPRTLKGYFKINKVGQSIQVEDANLEITSAQLSTHLAQCEGIYIIAITLGNEVDKLVAAAQQLNMLDALMLNACASVKMEEVYESLEKEIQVELQENTFLTKRYQPGQADVPLKVQSDMLVAINARDQIGLTSTKAGMLMPHKSMTAFIGVSRGGK